MSHVALAWLAHKGVSSPICGFSNVARMDEALAAGGKELEEEEVAFLEDCYVVKGVMGHS